MVKFQPEAESLPFLDLGTDLDPAYEHRIFEDVHHILGGKGLVGRPFVIYQQSSDWFAVSIDATVNGRGQHMIYVTGLQYDVPNRTDPKKLGVEKELQRTGILAQLSNTDNCTDPLTDEKRREIAATFGLNLVTSSGIIELRESVTRKKVQELLAQSPVT